MTLKEYLIRPPLRLRLICFAIFFAAQGGSSALLGRTPSQIIVSGCIFGLCFGALVFSSVAYALNVPRRNWMAVGAFWAVILAAAAWFTGRGLGGTVLFGLAGLAVAAAGAWESQKQR